MAKQAAKQTESAHRPNLLVRWWRKRRAYRREVAFAVWDLRERYGAAANAIARSSAAQTIIAERKRFWKKVAEQLARDHSPSRY